MLTIFIFKFNNCDYIWASGHTLGITFPYRLGKEWEDPVHTGMLSESQELLPDEDEEDDNEEDDKETKDAEPVKSQEDPSHKGR